MAALLPKYRELHARLVQTKGVVASLDDVIIAIQGALEDITAWSNAVSDAIEEIGDYEPELLSSEDEAWHDTKWQAFYEKHIDEYDGNDDAVEAAYQRTPDAKRYAAALQKESKSVEVATRVLDGATAARQLTDEELADEEGVPLKETIAQLKRAKKAFADLSAKLPALAGGYKP